MSISSSLNAGVAGLSANATRLATISDNIANSGTYGYKRATADFDSFVINKAPGAGTYSAGGVRATTQRLIDEQGALVPTSNALDLAISGRGMLPVTPSVSLGSTSGDRPLMMTTTGSFRADADGVLRTESGLVLLGWPANADGTIPVLPRDTVAGLQPVIINANQTAGDPNGLTQLSDSFAPTSITKDGSPVGNLTAVEVDENGYITATYDTGFTRRIYQIPVVAVPNPNGLIALNNQTYQVSPNSGSFFLWDAGDGPTGAIVGYAREGSTTDVAAELTALIQTQRAYSSNAKVIQTVDDMLQETTNIKR